MNLLGALEGLLFVVGDEGITLDNICDILELDMEEAKKLLLELKQSYEDEKRGLRIRFLGNAFKLTTKEEHKPYYQKLVTTKDNNTLSPAALEVLAIVAYNEPITRIKIDEIRGVDSTYVVRRLCAKGLIKECGKADLPGRPTLYKTTDDFLDYFNLSSIKDLPDIGSVENIDKEVDLYHSKYTEE